MAESLSTQIPMGPFGGETSMVIEKRLAKSETMTGRSGPSFSEKPKPTFSSTMTSPRNLAAEYLKEKSETREEYEGFCGELCDGIIHWLGEDRVSILYVQPSSSSDDLIYGLELWRFHMVAVVDGLVHDAWFPDIVAPPHEYAAAAFEGQSFELQITDPDGYLVPCQPSPSHAQHAKGAGNFCS